MAKPGSSFNPTPLGHEDNLGVRYHPRGIPHNTLSSVKSYRSQLRWSSKGLRYSLNLYVPTCLLQGSTRNDADSSAVGLGSNPGKGMDVCKCIVPSRRSRRAVSPLMRLVEGEESWEASDHPQGVLPQKWGESELNCTVTCMVRKVTANDIRTI
ncbi:uncharacterized protein TNCV_2068981 [Trichonephila clavipes]|uniref:Uncharacterized protein n=1 Tax=Trichonephila clavipes TaxID=2585209 RepID=A0A8X6W2U7_TRICX|nr:uncharacterized protein TNCV_2068981 [Trichonephila clavipes]